MLSQELDHGRRRRRLQPGPRRHRRSRRRRTPRPHRRRHRPASSPPANTKTSSSKSGSNIASAPSRSAKPAASDTMNTRTSTTANRCTPGRRRLEKMFGETAANDRLTWSAYRARHVRNIFCEPKRTTAGWPSAGGFQRRAVYSTAIYCTMMQLDLGRCRSSSGRSGFPARVLIPPDAVAQSPRRTRSLTNGTGSRLRTTPGPRPNMRRAGFSLARPPFASRAC